jgi:microcystin-dependent protein
MAVINGFNIIGSIFKYGHNNPPPGFLICNGSSLSVTQYKSLHQVIGYSYGGSGNFFSIPDLRGRFIKGRSSNPANTFYGDATVKPSSLAISSDGKHRHRTGFQETNVWPGSASLSNISGGTVNTNWITDASPSAYGAGYSGAHTHTSTGGNLETRPKNLYLNFIIKF